MLANLNTSKSGNSGGLAVDIDDTLAASVQRWMLRLDQEFPDARQSFIEDRDLTIQQLVAKYGFAKDVPYWGGNPEIHSRLVSIRTDPQEILNVDPIKDASECLSAISQIVPVKCYFSTRPASLFEATKAWLKINGFPEAELILTPNEIPNRDADKWKVDLISKRFPEISGIIDNSSEVVSHFPSDYGGLIFHFGVELANGNNSHIIQCPTWLDVKEQVHSSLERLVNLSPKV